MSSLDFHSKLANGILMYRGEWWLGNGFGQSVEWAAVRPDGEVVGEWSNRDGKFTTWRRSIVNLAKIRVDHTQPDADQCVLCAVPLLNSCAQMTDTIVTPRGLALMVTGCCCDCHFTAG